MAHFWTLLGLATIVSGVGYLGGMEPLHAPFLILGAGALVGSAVHAVRTTGDVLNPVALLVGLALVRIGLPALLLTWSAPPISWDTSGMLDGAWEAGRALALVGLASIVVGWWMAPGLLVKSACGLGDWVRGCEAQARSTLGARGTICLLVGLPFVAVYVVLNYADVLGAVADGRMRNQSLIVQGTSRYNFLGYWLVFAGTLAVSAHLLLVRHARWWVGLMPSFLVAILLTPFGGRVGAMAPLACALIVLWYRRPRKVAPGRGLLVFGSLMVVSLLYSAFVVFYRGHGIEEGWGSMTWAGLHEYAEQSVWWEMGILHPYAYATVFGEGVLEGGTLPAVGGFVLEAILGEEGVRPGLFIVQQVLSPSARWEIHTGLIVDLYLNYNLAATIVGCVLFGMVLRAAYEALSAHRRAPGPVLLYTIVLWFSLWIFYESVYVFFSLAVAAGVVGVILVFPPLPQPRAALP